MDRLRIVRMIFVGFVVVSALSFNGRANPIFDQVPLAIPGMQVDERYLTVGDHFFAPAEMTVHTGVVVRLWVTNNGHELHDLLILRGAQPVGGRPEVIPPGTRVRVDWVPPAPGSYVLICAVCPWGEMIAVVNVAY